MQKLIGTLFYWNRTFGLVETKIEFGAGFKVERYFLHRSRIIFQPTEICKDQIVRFVVLDKEPPAGKLPFAAEAEIFESVAQMQADSEKGGQGGAL